MCRARGLLSAASTVAEMHFFYDAQGKLAFAEYGGEKYGYAHNLQGDIVAILDRNGSIVVEYGYDAWGRVITTSGTMKDTLGEVSPFRYRGYVYDCETGLYYLRSRYYNPEWCRFVNADSIFHKYLSAAPQNLSAYARNSPIIASDASGLDAVVLLAPTSANDFGHISLLLQDKNDNWYYFYFGPTASDRPGATSVFPYLAYIDYKIIQLGRQDSIVKDGVVCLSELNKIDEVSRMEQVYTQYTYLTGDFVPSHDRARDLDKNGANYSLLYYNCTRASFEILLESALRTSVKNHVAITNAAQRVIPKQAYRALESTLKTLSAHYSPACNSNSLFTAI